MPREACDAMVFGSDSYTNQSFLALAPRSEGICDLHWLFDSTWSSQVAATAAPCFEVPNSCFDMFANLLSAGHVERAAAVHGRQGHRGGVSHRRRRDAKNEVAGLQAKAACSVAYSPPVR